MLFQLPKAVTAALHQILPDDPNKASHSRYITNQTVLEALAWQAKTGCPWRYLPPGFPSKSLLLSRRAEFISAGLFDQLLELALVSEAAISLVDATFIEAQQPLPERGWTKVGNGLKLQCLCGLTGQISDFQITSATPSESRLVEELLDNSSTPDTVKLLLADAAYDIKRLRTFAKARGYELVTTRNFGRRQAHLDPPLLRELARRVRWAIERVFAWLKSWTGVARCRARSLSVYKTNVILAIANYQLK